MKVGTVGVVASSRAELRQVAQGMEASSFDSFFWADHLQMFPAAIWTPDVTEIANFVPNPNAQFDLIAVLGAVGMETDDLLVGACVTEPIRRHPATIAQEWLSLHHITAGRAILGIGAGEAENLVPYGIPFDHPMGRLEEAVRIIRMLWESDDPISYDGEFWKLDNAVIGLGPFEGTYPPIWTAGNRPRGLRVSGELADGWFPWGLSVDDYARHQKTIRAAAANVGRDLDGFTWGLVPVALIAETRDACYDALRSPLCKWTALINGHELFEKYGIEHPLRAGYQGIVEYLPSGFSREEHLDAIAKVPDELVQEFFVFGTPDDIVEHVRQYDGLNHCVFGDFTALGSPALAMKSGPLWEDVIKGLHEI